jgi:hypothetical protein
MRDVATRLLDAEAATPEDTPEIAALRADLRRRHEGYVRRHGPINRFTLRRTGRTDPRTGEERYARVAPPVMRHLKTDPSAPLVKALEVFDETTQTATPAEIMSKRVVVQREPVRHVDDPADAVWVSIERHARVDLDTVGELLGLGPAEARTALGELVYEDPADGRLVPAAEYLSGNVRDKLDRARAAVEERPELAVNVQALENALPADLGADEVAPRLGAVWIDAETHQRFLCELLGDDKLAVAHPTEGSWVVDGNRHSVAARSEWGTESMNALAIAEATFEQRPIQVTVKVEGGRARRRPRGDGGGEGQGARDAGALRGVALGGPGANGPAARRVQPTLQLARPARLRRRRRAPDAAGPRRHVPSPAPAPAQRGRAHARRAGSRALPRGRGGQDGRDGDWRDGAQAPRTGLKAVRRGPKPHAGAVLARVAAALPARASWPHRPTTWTNTGGAPSSRASRPTTGTR